MFNRRADVHADEIDFVIDIQCSFSPTSLCCVQGKFEAAYGNEESEILTILDDRFQGIFAMIK